MESRRRDKYGFWAGMLLFAGMAVIMLYMGLTIKDLEKTISKDKNAAIDAVEKKYQGIILESQEREKKQQAKYDSLATIKQVRKEAMKINKNKSDEKIRRIDTAGINTARFLSDSVLRAAGLR